MAKKEIRVGSVVYIKKKHWLQDTVAPETALVYGVDQFAFSNETYYETLTSQGREMLYPEEINMRKKILW